MKSYQITYMNDEGKFRTVVHWALRNEPWQEVADREFGVVIKVLEEIKWSKWDGMKCRVLFDEMLNGKMKGDIVYV